MNCANKEGDTPLHLGTFKINIPYFHVKIIILNYFEACFYKKTDLVELFLLNKNVDVNSMNKKGDTPLHLGYLSLFYLFILKMISKIIRNKILKLL